MVRGGEESPSPEQRLTDEVRGAEVRLGAIGAAAHDAYIAMDAGTPAAGLTRRRGV